MLLTLFSWVTNTYFELRNHDSLPVDAFIIQPATYQATVNLNEPAYKQGRAEFMRIPAKKGSAVSAMSFPIITSQPTYLIISYKDKDMNDQQAMYSFSVGKTIYIALDQSKIRPQKGTFGKTASGKSLRNNVASHDIIKLTKTEQELINQQLRDSKEFQELIKAHKLKPIKTSPSQWKKGY